METGSDEVSFNRKKKDRMVRYNILITEYLVFSETFEILSRSEQQRRRGEDSLRKCSSESFAVGQIKFVYK